MLGKRRFEPDALGLKFRSQFSVLLCKVVSCPFGVVLAGRVFAIHRPIITPVFRDFAARILCPQLFLLRFESFVEKHFEISLVAEASLGCEIAGAGQILAHNADGDILSWLSRLDRRRRQTPEFQLTTSVGRFGLNGELVSLLVPPLLLFGLIREFGDALRIHNDP